MESSELTDDEVKSIEQLVSRLAQLCSSIQSIKGDILTSNTLPDASSFHASAQILQRHLQSVQDGMDENAALFTRMAVRPSRNYPGRTQEGVLTQLLRKKLEPDVAELVTEGQEAAELATPEGIERLRRLWGELRVWTQERIARYVREEAGDVYTKEERAMGIENVRTGLKGSLDEGSDNESDEDEDEDEDTQLPPPAEEGADAPDDVDIGDAVESTGALSSRLERGPELETLLWFKARGDFAVPANIEYERKTGVCKGFEGVNLYEEEQKPEKKPAPETTDQKESGDAAA